MPPKLSGTLLSRACSRSSSSPCSRTRSAILRSARTRSPARARGHGHGERADLLPGGGVAVAPGALAGGLHPVPVDQHAAVGEPELVAVRLDGGDHARLLW